MNKTQKILLSHGSGGKLSNELVRDLFLPSFSNSSLNNLGDAGLFEINQTNFALTTDSFVVQPLFFNGGNIGKLCVCGTVNDLAVSGAEPLFLSIGFIIEEGFEIEELKKIINSISETAKQAGVEIIAGDTKVVEKKSADKIFINTSGVGIIKNKIPSDEIKEGDSIIINGTLGDHAVSIISAREDLPISAEAKSDSAPLNLLISPLLEKFKGRIKFMRDITRGGLATVLNEMVMNKDFGTQIYEESIPLSESVKAVTELLGYDPIYLANEGKALFVVDSLVADEILNYMRELPFGENSAKIGEITSENKGRVVLKTITGAGRILDMLIGDQLPRIC